MKIIKIFGSLCEQMFQYALYLRLKNQGDNVALLTPKQWIASQFALTGYTEATANDVAPFRASLSDRLKGIFGKTADKGNVITDTFGVFARDVIDATEGLCIGSWASPRYFEAANEDVSRAFIVPECQLSDAAKGILAHKGRRETVALHIHQPTSPSNTCTTDYYNWAIANIRTYITDAQFLVFTSDAELVKQQLLLPDDSIFVSTANLSDFDLMQAMLHSNHIICANTLTSWWAAWLNPDPDKIVIVPQRWSADADNKPTDLIPIYWTAIPVT